MGRVEVGENKHRDPWGWGWAGPSFGRRRQTIQNNTHFLQKYETYTEILITSQRGIYLDWDGLTQRHTPKDLEYCVTYNRLLINVCTK